MGSSVNDKSGEVKTWFPREGCSAIRPDPTVLCVQVAEWLCCAHVSVGLHDSCQLSESKNVSPSTRVVQLVVVLHHLSTVPSDGYSHRVGRNFFFTADIILT